MSYTKSDLQDLSFEIIGCAIEVHRELGPGLLESIYHRCLKHELKNKGIQYESEFKVPVIYKGRSLETDLKCDLLVENKIVIELKSIDKFHPIHDAQLITYMKLLQVPKGILFNFNSNNLVKEGQKTFVNEIYRTLK